MFGGECYAWYITCVVNPFNLNGVEYGIKFSFRGFFFSFLGLSETWHYLHLYFVYVFVFIIHSQFTTSWPIGKITRDYNIKKHQKIGKIHKNDKIKFQIQIKTLIWKILKRVLH